MTVHTRKRRSSLGPSDGAGPSLTTRPARPSRLHRRVALVVLVLVVAFAATTVHVFVWPNLPPLPDRVDAIIELAGPGDRDAAAIALAMQGRAPVLVQSTIAGDARTDRCLQPLPDVTIECFVPDPETTRGEARWIGEQAAQQHWRSIIIVTTPDHAWRARLRVERCFPGIVYVATSPLPKWDWFAQIPYQWAATVKAELFQRGC